MPFLDFTAGDVLTAANMDTTFRQGIMTFADASARDTALTGVLAEGMYAYLEDTDTLTRYSGTDWIVVGGAPGTGGAFVSGTTTGTTTADGDLTISFGVTFSFAPNVVVMPFVTGATTQISCHLTQAATTTQQVVRFTRNDAVLASTGVQARWIAVGVLVL